MHSERMSVSLDEYLSYLLKKWKTILSFLLIFISAFCISAKLLGEEIVIASSEEYIELKKQEASVTMYIENAPLMKIDPVCVQEIIVYVSNIREQEELKNYVDSGNVWSGFEDENMSRFSWDIVTWLDENQGKSAEITIHHYDERYCNLMAEFLCEKIQAVDENLKIKIGTVHVTSDPVIEDVQNWYKNRMKAITGQLEYARAGYTIETSLPIAVVAGGTVGFLASTIVLLISFMLCKKNSQ